MRVLQVVTRNELRGAEVFAGQLSDALVERGHEVVQAALYARPPEGSEPLIFRAARGVELQGRRKGRIEPRTMWRLRRLVREFRPEILQANGFHALKYAALLRRAGVGRYEIVYRNIGLASDWVQSGLKLSWGRWLARSIASVVSVSDASREDFCATYRVSPSRAFTVSRGVVIPSADELAGCRSLVHSVTGFATDCRLVMHVGGMTPEKDHAGLIESFARVHRKLPDVRLVCCGDGPLIGEVQAGVDRLGLTDAVRLLGNRQDARDLMCGADLLVLCSTTEGMPGVVLEAGARRIPVVSTAVGGVEELVQPGVSGMLVPAGDRDGLVSAIVETLADHERAGNWAAELHRRVVGRFSFTDSVDRFEQIYESVRKG